MAVMQHAYLGSAATTVQAGLTRLQAQRYLQRLWEFDASLFSGEPATQAAIRDRLGWLRITDAMVKDVDMVHQFSQEVRRAGFTHALLLGMGGSGLFPDVCRHLFNTGDGGLDLAVLDTTDPTAILASQQRCPLDRLLVIVSSKSGSTIEITTLSKYFYDVLKTVRGQPGEHCIAITDRGTPLEAQAASWQFRRAFVLGPESGSDVGGRFAALTYFGLVPAALMGIDITQLLTRATRMLHQCSPDAAWPDNPAVQLGVALAELALIGKDKLTFLCPPALESFGSWMEQLVAESTGKQGKGIAPVIGEPLLEPAHYSTDRVFIELQLASEQDASLDRQVTSLINAGHPAIRIRWHDRYDLGGEVIKWSLATTIAGSLLHINPFDEPNVQESKDRTKTLLSQYVKEGRLPDHPAEASGSLTSVFQQLHANDYVAILSFLPRLPRLDQGVQQMRHRIADVLGRTTLLEIGPRYLHSTGQLYKGGPDAGVFLLLTADDPVDVAIPGEPFSFSVLKHAQALGDLQAMRQKGRRIVRVHLRGDLEQEMRRLLDELDQVLTSVASR